VKRLDHMSRASASAVWDGQIDGEEIARQA
jgi:hypothetical protein